METQAHLNLKRLALAFLRRQGCAALAAEVRCPISRYRVDVAGYLDLEPLPALPSNALHDSQPPSALNGAADHSSAAQVRYRSAPPRTIVIECKQSRADFFQHCDEIAPLLEAREKYEAIRASIQQHRIKRLEPQLRHVGSSLFAELDDWDFDRSNLRSYRTVLRQLRRIDVKLHGQTKFFLMARYRLADQLFIAAPQGMIRASELPPGWGLLEQTENRNQKSEDRKQKTEMCIESLEVGVEQDAAMLTITVPAPCHDARPDRRIRLLRNIAVAACRGV